MRMVAPRARPGFTLVEVLVAIVVAGTAAAAAYGVVGSMAASRRAVERAREAALPGAGARQTLEDWLRAAALFDGGGRFDGADRRAAGVARDELAFAVEDGGALRPGPRRIRLWIERSTFGPSGLLAEVAALGPRAEPPETLEVARAAGALDVRYRTTVHDHVVWVDAWASDSVLPEAVELRVAQAQEVGTDPRAGGFPALLRLPVRVPLRPGLQAIGGAR
ncbi:MAG TPA: prepilin-type N-terminal cleavage/methylation domain-containing protein [Longimicrobium sp.]|nr:prepilin-type N-terminal cleavage/methylation domain-containing protein [Longimicrobium sp.]